MAGGARVHRARNCNLARLQIRAHFGFPPFPGNFARWPARLLSAFAMAIREGRWDCTSCGSTAIYGRHVDCPGCGRPRPAGVRFYLTANAPVVTDARQLAEARAGADWVCARCGASNRATVHTCAGCGAAHEVESVQPVAEYTLANTPRSGDESSPSADASTPESPAAASGPSATSAAGSASESPTGSGLESTEGTSVSPTASAPGSAPAVAAAPSSPVFLSSGPATPAAGSTPPPASGVQAKASEISSRYWVAVFFGTEERWMRWRPVLRRGLMGAVGLVVLGFLTIKAGDAYSSRTPAPRPAVVDSVVWERLIEVEEHGLFADEGWELPDSARDVVRSERVRDYRQELTGYRTVTRDEARTRQVLKGYEEETRTVSEREQTGTRTYTCGTRDLGNGYFEDVECTEPEYETVSRTETVSVPVYEDETYYVEVSEEQPVYRQVPIMATYYTYRVPRWTTVETLRSSGDWSTRPAWPTWPPAPDSTTIRREGERRASNRAVLRTKDGVIDVHLDEDELRRLRPGQRVAYGGWGRRRPRAAVLPPDSLPACRRWHTGRGKPPPDSLGCSPRPATPPRR